MANTFLKITADMVDNARREANTARSRYENLRREYEIQRASGEEEPEWVDTRTIPMDRKEQATVRVFYVGHKDPEGYDAVDFYPIDGAIVWKMPWVFSNLAVSAEKRNAYEKALTENATVDHADSQMTMLNVPCLTHECGGLTLISLHDLRVLEEKDWLHERNTDLLCERCKGATDKLLEKWRETCPLVFQDGKDKTDPALFPPNAWRAVKAWGENISGSARSLYVYGQSGVCKSRMAFQALLDFVVPAKLDFKVYPGGAFRREQEMIVSTRFDRRGDRITSNSDTIDVLVFDDFGQDDLNPSMKSNLRLLVDQRLGNGLRTVFLANVSPDELVQVYGPGMDTQTLIRRIKDYCDVVPVHATKEGLDGSIERKRAKDALATEPEPEPENPF